MATIRTSASDTPLRINYEGQVHDLVITPRGGLEPDVLTKVIGKTVLTWMRAYTAITNTTYLMPEGSQSACEVVGVEPDSREPHCTVWNKTYTGASLTCHSNDNGQGAVDAYRALQNAIASIRENASFLFENVPVQSTPTVPQIVPRPQTIPVALNPFIRTTQAPFKVSGQVIPNTVGIESGKTDSPNWNKPGMIASEAYDKTGKVQFDEGQIVLYSLTTGENVRVKSANDTLLIEFQTFQGDIAVWQREDTVYEGKTIKSDWSQALSKLGLEDVQAGQVFSLPASYIAMKASRVSNDKQYLNFYGFFNAPATAEPLAPTGTESSSAPNQSANDDIPF